MLSLRLLRRAYCCKTSNLRNINVINDPCSRRQGIMDSRGRLVMFSVILVMFILATVSIVLKATFTLRSTQYILNPDLGSPWKDSDIRAITAVSACFDRLIVSLYYNLR